MAKINILSDELINRIAAGEVVQRPASVLKELIENAIDAGAGRIEVEISGGGKRSIIVKDDGEGMVRDDLILSVERHTTSKIKSIGDMANLYSLGFRGEALASIAAVSKIEIVSKPSNGNTGNRILVEGGRIKFVEETGAAKGTLVKIKGLFFNVPARRKFLKTDATEEYWCERTITEYILSHEDISFRFVKDGKMIYTFSRDDELGYKASKLLLKGFSTQSENVNFTDGEIKIRGLIARPQLNSPDRDHQFFFVNGRPVRNAALSYAFREAYGSSVPERRFPPCILLITMPPFFFDVNVHPSKREIKFADEKKVKTVIKNSVSQSLKSSDTSLNISGISSRTYEQKGDEGGKVQHVKEEQPEFSASQGGETAGPRIIGQYAMTYIIVEENGDLFLIDQHAAQERINYEKLLDSISAGNSSVQYLLNPVVIELIGAGAEKITENIEIIRLCGFDIEPFGKNSFKIGGVPSFLPDFNVEETINELADVLIREKKMNLDQKADEISRMLACRRSIKAGDRLEPLSMKRIIEDLNRTKYPQTCPHGRPVKVKLEKPLIEKWFKRDYRGQ